MATGSFSSIKIHRSLPVRAGYVQVPPNREKDKTTVTVDAALAAATGSKVTRLPDAGGHSTAGTKHGCQEMIELAGVAIDSVDDAYNAIKALV